MNTPDNLQEFLNGIFELTPEEIEIYEEAFIHSSNNSLPNNQRLAFLGDSVIRLIIREHSYKKYRDWNIGKLTELCKGIESDENFTIIANNLKIVNHMHIQNPPPDINDNKTLNAEAFEALIGALYLIKGLEQTRRIVLKYLFADIEQFKDDDKGYLNWIKNHSVGYVVNCNRQPNPNYLILHRADCNTICGIPAKGKFWTKDYIKICSLNPNELENWAQKQYEGELQRCPICKP
ncbi:Ribonuclease 3 [Methanosarcinales archaeon]|nr:Ribonuclease 3 [Methanosarcinales archaeon]